MELEQRLAAMEEQLAREQDKTNFMAGKIAGLTTVCLALIADSSNNSSSTLCTLLERLKENTLVQLLGSGTPDESIRAAEDLIEAALAPLWRHRA